MNAQEAQTLRLHEIVVWTPDGSKGEVIAIDGSGVKVRWEDDQCGYIDLPTCCLKSKGYLERDALPESRRTTA
jgi:hypothetical protein